MTDELQLRTRVQERRTLPASMRPLPRWQWVAGLIAAAVLVMLLVAGGATAPTIQEDDPRWDCRTMGNHICGPGAPHPAGYYGN